ncbi:hypothetical protein ANN_11767 [Periplaneta americana]|uniref:Uncharacterized protein n=1 Tax=Periplaneta americana TaxID=6978 RepID=A0ABQ8T7S2_PERAM|nr:hypothetical protein ANN_11767 [Periplaneta americana]
MAGLCEGGNESSGSLKAIWDVGEQIARNPLLDSPCASPVDDSHVLSNGRAREDSADFKKRLRKELVNRDGHNLSVCNEFFQIGTGHETAYHEEEEEEEEDDDDDDDDDDDR